MKADKSLLQGLLISAAGKQIGGDKKIEGHSFDNKATMKTACAATLCCCTNLNNDNAIG